MAAGFPQLLRRVFNIYPGEEKSAFLFSILGFFSVLSITLGLKFSDALFLIHVGADSLPIAYGFAACCMLFLSTVLLYAFHSFSTYRIFLSVLMTGMLFYTLFLIGLFLNFEAFSWIWFALRIFGYLLFVTVLTSYWTFVDQYFHIQDAKRLYSLFTSMLFLGAASTGIIMRSGILNLKFLMIVELCLLSLTLLIVIIIHQKTRLVIHEESEPAALAEGGFSVISLIKGILKSRFTLFLMTGNLLIQLLAVLTEYNYLSAFDSYFDPGVVSAEIVEGTNAQLTLFLGQLITGVSFFNIFFGLFIYSRLIRRFGMPILLIITPLLFLTFFSGSLLNGTLFFPILGYFVVEGTLYVIDDNNFNLLLNATPTKLKYKIRVIIESFFEPIGMLISALLLSFVTIDSKLIGLFLSSILCIIALMLHSEYLKGIFINLSTNAIQFQKSAFQWLNRLSGKNRNETEKELLNILKNKDEASQIFASEALISFKDRKILERLLKHADHLDAETKIQVIGLIENSPFSKDPLVIEYLDYWMRDEQNLQLKSTVHFYLASHGLLHPDRAAIDLHSPNLTLRGAAIIAFMDSWAHLPPHTIAANRTLAAVHLKRLLDSKSEEDICMGIKILGITTYSEEAEILIPYLRNPSIKIIRTAVAAIEKIVNEHSLQQVKPLLAQLTKTNDQETVKHCLRALGKINDSSSIRDIVEASFHFRPNERRIAEDVIVKMGLRNVPALLAMLQDHQMPLRSRLLAGRVLGRIALPQLRTNLSNIIELEIERAYFYLYHFLTIQKENPELDLKILTDTLFSNYQTALDYIIQLLGIAGEVEDAEVLSYSIQSRSPRVRSQVLEALETTSEPKIFRMVQPLIEEIPYEEKMKFYLKMGGIPLKLPELLDKLEFSPTHVDRLIAVTLKYRLEFPDWRDSLRKQIMSGDEIFNHFAYELLQT